MLRNYLKIAWRSLWKSRLVTLINISGLAIGIGGCLFIGLFILDELKYDQHFRFKDRIYRLISTHENKGTSYQSAQTNGDIAANFIRQFPEVENSTRLLPADEGFIFSNESAFKEKIVYTDSAFTEIFDLILLLGDKDKCLVNPSSIIISRTTAVKLFGDDWRQKGIIGETLSVDGWLPLNITAVFNDLPYHTHFKSNLFASVPSGFEDWISDKSKVYTYVLLNEHSNVDNLNKKLKVPASSMSSLNDRDGTTHISLQTLTSIHLFSSSFEDDNAILGNIKNIYALVLVSFFLIVIAISNFVNLYTSSSFNRLKEIGVRKAIGALSVQLRFQFLSETFLITAIALGIAIVLLIGLLPVSNELTGKNLSSESFLDRNALLFIAALTLVTSFLAGFYPSIYLSGTKAMEALKGTGKRSTTLIDWRKGLIILQFIISGIMIILSIVSYRQVILINNKSLGFDKENIIALANPYMLGSTQKIIGLRNELLAIPGIEQVSITGYTPSQNRWGNLKITFPDRNENSVYAQPANWLTVDEGFIKTMGLTLIVGRNFLENHKFDKEAIIINKKAVHQFNLNANGKDPIGAELSVSDQEKTSYQNYTVVGVVADFNFGSLHDQIKPIVMRLGYHRFEMALRLSSKYSKKETISRVEAVWQQTLPIIPFEYYFIKDRFDSLHKSDITASKVFSIFSLVTVILSAMGLFSIVTYTVANRSKEIGIRKLLGASEGNIALLLSKQFLKLVIISYVLSLPIAWIITNKWLADFVYRVDTSWWAYIITGLILIVITILTVGYQSIKTASMNPIDNLRYE